ncbi:MAG: DUF4097 family beta strand repeat protein [candidate division WOR-3 bacterium]|nr:MAG: DUF4097 family beta strand repeat protein [candidate division WOR-3 bacterium]
MSEERDRILRMLEEGKVTANQAARLIEALGSSRRSDEHEIFRMGRRRSQRHFFGRVHPPRPPRMRVAELDAIPDIVASAVSSAMKSGFGPHAKAKTDFPNKHSLFIKCVSGDVAIRGWDEDRVMLTEVGNMTRVRERDERVMVRAISGDVEARVPREARVELTSVSGDVGISGFHGRLGLRSVSGDVELEDVSGELKVDVVSGELTMLRVAGTLSVESRSGDTRVEPQGKFSGEITSKSGDIVLVLGSDADVVLDMQCEEDGDLSVDLDVDFEKLEEDQNRLKIRLGEGSRTLVLRTKNADISVKSARG